MAEKTIQRSLRLPADLVQKIEQLGHKNERNFSRQVVYMLRIVESEEARTRDAEEQKANRG